MGPLAQQSDQRHTYAEYLTWDDDERWELIDGIPYNMTPAPRRVHQKIAGEIFLQIADFLKGKPCEVYIAPLDVRLPLADEPDGEITTVVQPDIVVVCAPPPQTPPPQTRSPDSSAGSAPSPESPRASPPAPLSSVPPLPPRRPRVARSRNIRVAGPRALTYVTRHACHRCGRSADRHSHGSGLRMPAFGMGRWRSG